MGQCQSSCNWPNIIQMNWPGWHICLSLVRSHIKSGKERVTFLPSHKAHEQNSANRVNFECTYCECVSMHWRECVYGWQCQPWRWHTAEQIVQIPPHTSLGTAPIRCHWFADLLARCPSLSFCRPATWNSRCFRPTVDLPLLRPGLQTLDFPKGTHQVPAWEKRGELRLPSV